MADFGSLTGKAVATLNSTSNAALLIFGFAIIIILIIAMRFVLDIAIDLWKIPFAMGVDLLDFYSASFAYLNFAAAIASITVFWILSKRGHHVGKAFGILAAAEAFIGAFYLIGFGNYANLIPTATLLMFFAIKSD